MFYYKNMKNKAYYQVDIYIKNDIIFMYKKLNSKLNLIRKEVFNNKKQKRRI